MAPLRFFRDSRKTTRRSTAVKGSTSHPNIFPPSLKFLTRGHPRSGHQARSTKVTSLQLLSSVRATFQSRSIWNFLHFMTPPGSTRCISGIFRFRPLGSGHEVTSPIEKAWEKLSYDIKVTKTIENAQLAQKSVLGPPFTDSRGHICPLTSPRSSKVTRGQKQYFDNNFWPDKARALN